MPKVNPEILAWAREAAQLSLGDAAQKLGIKTTKNATAAEKLGLLEAGQKEPTYKRLMKMADVYHRPILTFYLAKPPARGARGGDFRKLPDDYSREENALLDALIRDIRARQGMVRSLMVDEEEAEPLPFINSISTDVGVQAAAKQIWQTLGISLDDIRRCSNKSDVFTLIRSKAEEASIFVLLVGDLGSHHTDIGIDIFRGYTVADPIAPFIVINDNDSKGAWTFTLLHELAHLWLGAEGVSNSSVWAEGKLEKFCNDVAATILLADGEIDDLPVFPETNLHEVISVITKFSHTAKLSNTMVAYSLYKAGKLTWDQYKYLNQKFRQHWIESKQAAKEKSGQGPTYPTVKRHRLGRGIIDFVDRTMGEGILTPTKAAKILGVKPHNLNQILG